MPVTCSKCAKELPRDPALLVPCPVCCKPAGKTCTQRTTGKHLVHARRERQAIDCSFTDHCTDGFYHDFVSHDTGPLFQNSEGMTCKTTMQ